MFKEILKGSNNGVLYLVPLAFSILSTVRYSRSEHNILGAAPALRILISDSQCLIVNKVQKVCSVK